MQGLLNAWSGNLYLSYCSFVTSHITSTLHPALLKFHQLTWENFIKKLYFFLEIPMWVLLVGRLHEILT